MTRCVALMVLSISSTALAACSSDDDRRAADDGGHVVLITRPEGGQSVWQATQGPFRVRDGCITIRGHLAVFPAHTTLVGGSTAIRVGESDPIPLDGDTEVEVAGSNLPVEVDGEPTIAGVLDEANEARWDSCRRRLRPWSSTPTGG